MTFGYDILRSASAEPISVTGVSLVDAQDVQVQEALVVPLLGASSTGIHSTYPPAAQELERLALTSSWAGRRVVDQEPVPLDTDHPQELVLGLKATGPRGLASGIRVGYTSGGEEHVLTTPTSLEIVAGTCS